VLVVHARYDWSLEERSSSRANRSRAVLRESEAACAVTWANRSPISCAIIAITEGDHYFRMTPVGAVPWSANDEVDEVRWLPAGDAASLLTYDADRDLVAGVLRGDRGGS
jgi:8-oxo-dGTP diphosphatase